MKLKGVIDMIDRCYYLKIGENRLIRIGPACNTGLRLCHKGNITINISDSTPLIPLVWSMNLKHCIRFHTGENPQWYSSDKIWYDLIYLGVKLNESWEGSNVVDVSRRFSRQKKWFTKKKRKFLCLKGQKNLISKN